MENKCPDSQKYLYLIRLMLDQEASVEDEAFLLAHIEECSHCLKEYQLEQQVRMMLKSKMTQRSVPEDLAKSIRNKILQSNLNDN